MIRKSIFIAICCVYLIGCNERVPLEKASLILLIALDKTSNGKIRIGTSIPIFHPNKQKDTVEHWVQASTVYNGISKIDTKLTGFVTSSKAEIILIGKKFAQEANWIRQLDSSYRDPYSNINAKVILIDGLAEDFFKVKRHDKPALSSYIHKVINSSVQNNQAVSPTIEQLMREKNEEGLTQSLPIIKITNDEIDTIGIAFLDQYGRYLTRISKKEVKFFNLVNNSKKTGRMIVHLTLSPKKSNQKPNASILIQDAKRKINVDFKKGKFIFNIHINMNVALIEKTNENQITNQLDDKKNIVKLEQEIKQELDNKLQNTLLNIQKKQIDPIGLTLYARAFQYEEWKKIKKDWLYVLSRAKINVKTKVKIKDTGTIKS